MAWATDPKNLEELQKTPAFLNQTVVDKKELISFFYPDNNANAVWGWLTLDDSALKNLKDWPTLK
jgi:hypothetical protein